MTPAPARRAGSREPQRQYKTSRKKTRMIDVAAAVSAFLRLDEQGPNVAIERHRCD